MAPTAIDLFALAYGTRLSFGATNTHDYNVRPRILVALISRHGSASNRPVKRISRTAARVRGSPEDGLPDVERLLVALIHVTVFFRGMGAFRVTT